MKYSRVSQAGSHYFSWEKSGQSPVETCEHLQVDGLSAFRGEGGMSFTEHRNFWVTTLRWRANLLSNGAILGNG